MINQPVKILIVDDEPDILEFIGYNLKKEGYQILVANNGLEAIKIAKEQLPDLILLDVMMPKMDGLQTCEYLRTLPEFKDTSIIFLTALSDETAELKGFSSGADDYITKPIKPKLLLTRIKARLKKTAPAEATHLIEIGDIVIDRVKYQITFKGDIIDVARKEFELLSLLASKPGRVFLRQEILDKIWGNDVIIGDRTIDVHIRKLRSKIGDEKIKTVKGVGYKFD
jgi:two-component system alkaline phosphatase synthesis response regulator PhoP